MQKLGSDQQAKLKGQDTDPAKAARLAAARAILADFKETGAKERGAKPASSKDSLSEPDRLEPAPSHPVVQGEAAYWQAREAAVRYIGLDKGKSSGKVQDRLRKQGYSSALAQEVVCDLTDLGYIDDERACAKIVRRHQGKRAKSRAYMLALFLQQGVARASAEAYLDKLPSDQESLEEILASEELAGGPAEARLVRRLQGRGYKPGLIQSSIRRLKEAHDQ
ncbi:MAG: RecX family transcriptional regulator [Eubacteriales bacterium]|nr:RecX family transcriptional regulator [Eubacteriales bacterium]